MVFNEMLNEYVLNSTPPDLINSYIKSINVRINSEYTNYKIRHEADEQINRCEILKECLQHKIISKDQHCFLMIIISLHSNS